MTRKQLSSVHCPLSTSFELADHRVQVFVADEDLGYLLHSLVCILSEKSMNCDLIYVLVYIGVQYKQLANRSSYISKCYHYTSALIGYKSNDCNMSATY